MKKTRLDEALVQRQLYPSRARARDAILRGTISVNHHPVDKPAFRVSDSCILTASDEAQHYVSRAALKLKAALAFFQLSPASRVCLDIGASTGGFSQVLLEAGAAHVVAVDVGHGQLHPFIAQHPLVLAREGVNVRYFEAADLPQDLSFIVCDVSFISLTLALASLALLAPVGTDLIALIKPQFEAGAEALNDRGVVLDTAHHNFSITKVTHFLKSYGWQVSAPLAAPVRGGDGNQEFLIAARKVTAEDGS